jgi:hypothetical protein
VRGLFGKNWRWARRGKKEAGLKASATEKNGGDVGEHLTDIQRDAVVAEEECGKAKKLRNRVLTYSRGMLILVSSLVATLQDREAEQTLFDN